MPGSPSAPTPDIIRVSFEEIQFEPDSQHFRARDIKVVAGEYTVTGKFAEGVMDKEIAFTGGATLTYRGQTINGETIRFSPPTKRYRIEGLHSSLSPEFLGGRLLSPLNLRGSEIYGRQNEPIIGIDIDATTCERANPHYFVRAGEVRVEPGKTVILKRATLVFWGKRIITLPTLVIPLNRRIRNSGYTPQFGRSVDEGFFVKSALNYLLADRAPGLFRLDLMEKKGIGTGIEQDWNLAKTAGLLALYAIPTGGTNKNLSGRLNNRFNLGGGEMLTLDTDYQKNSYQALPETTNSSTRLGFNRSVAGSNTGLNMSKQSTQSGGSSNTSLAANLTQGFQFGRSISTNFNADYSQYKSGSGSSTLQTTETLATRFQADQRSQNYSLQLTANRNVPIGQRATGSFFGGVERLPELSLTNYRFTQGWLSRIPANFLLSAGRYMEGGSGSASSTTQTDRAVFGFDITNTRLSLSKSTDLNVAGGFQQSMYGDGFAQYVIRNNTTLTQRWNKRSGVNFNYTYQRPEGGTPFRFDQLGQYHALNADAGFLDDRRLQLTARVGYDFARTSFGGAPAQPWQTLSANLLIRPVNWARMRNLFTFDPNTGKMVSATASLQIRGHRELSFDTVARYDPSRHRFGNINSYINLPIGNQWRVLAILQYNGYLNRFESRNLEVIKSLSDCMEASFTYIDNPFGFRNDRQFYFQIRIKALPTIQRFGTGQYGQALDTGIGEIY